jgi:ABC-type branched-subunit amino acid transport system ATPase component
MSLLSVQNLVAGYGDLEILHGVDLEIEEGDYDVVIGPNGAGKTTLLKSILGFTNRMDGTVSLRGDNITTRDPEDLVRDGIGFVPQEENIFANLTVIENIRMGAYTREEIPDRVLDDIYRRFPRLEERTEQRGGTLSGGERKMLAIARALVTEPDLLILDEPSSGLAPHLVEELFDQIDAIYDEGTTILLVEQNAEEALSRGDYGYVLTQGKIQLEDECETLLEMDEVQENYLGG